MNLDNRDYMQRDFQTIGTKNTYDEFGDKISIKKSRRVSISYKLNKRGKKMIDNKIDLEIQNILNDVTTKWLPIYQFVRKNTSRECLLVKKGTTEAASIDYIVKSIGVSRAVVSKCINTLIKKGYIKKNKRAMYLNPMIYLPLVNDFELRCLMERFEEDFTKPLDRYREDLSKLLQVAQKSAKAELDFESENLVPTKHINVE